MQDSDIQQLIQEQINAGTLPATNANTLYFVFLPKGVTSGGRLRVEMPGRRGYLITLDALTGRVSTQRLEL